MKRMRSLKNLLQDRSCVPIVSGRAASDMKRSRLALAGVAGAIAAFAIGGVTVANAADPIPNPKESLPANIHGENPYAAPAPGGPTEQPKPLDKNAKIKAAKEFKEKHPEAVVCHAPDGTPVDGLLVDWVVPLEKVTKKDRQKVCDRLAKDMGAEELAADE